MKRTLAVATWAALTLAGCVGPRRYEMVQAPKVNLSTYKAIHVAPVDIEKWITAHPEVREGEEYEHVRRELEHAQIRITKDVIVGIQTGSLAEKLQIVSAAKPGTLAVQMEVTDFNMRADPEAIKPRVKVGGVLDKEEGPGWKWGKIQITTRLVDGGTGNSLAEGKADHRIVSGSRFDIG